MLSFMFLVEEEKYIYSRCVVCPVWASVEKNQQEKVTETSAGFKKNYHKLID